MRQSRESMSWSSPAPYVPGREPKMRVVARRSSPCSARSAWAWARTKLPLGGLVQGGGQAYGVVEQADGVRERVAEEAGDAQRDVDAGAAQLLVRDRPPGR